MNTNCGLGEQPVNVGAAERWASLYGGGLLALYGISRGRACGLALTAIGAGLVYRGYTGHCGAYQALGMTSAQHDLHGAIPSQQAVEVEECVTSMNPAVEF